MQTKFLRGDQVAFSNSNGAVAIGEVVQAHYVYAAQEYEYVIKLLDNTMVTRSESSLTRVPKPSFSQQHESAAKKERLRG